MSNCLNPKYIYINTKTRFPKHPKTSQFTRSMSWTMQTLSVDVENLGPSPLTTSLSDMTCPRSRCRRSCWAS